MQRVCAPVPGTVRVESPVVVKLKLLLPMFRVLLFKVKVPEPVEIILPLMVAVESSEVYKVLALIVRAVTLPVRPETWNLAEAVLVPPIAKLSVILNGASTPKFSCQ